MGRTNSEALTNLKEVVSAVSLSMYHFMTKRSVTAFNWVSKKISKFKVHVSLGVLKSKRSVATPLIKVTGPLFA